MAEKKEFYFPSSDKRTEIHGVIWSPESGNFRAVLQITHGMIEFIERYEGFEEYLTDRGFLVAGHDHLGHGKSIGSREDLGYIAKKRGSDCMAADMHHLRTLLLSGEKDPVGDLGRGVRRVEAQLRKAGIRDLTCRLYPEYRHEILNERGKEQVYQDIADWCGRILQKKAEREDIGK